VRLQTCYSQGQEAWIPKYHDHIRDQCCLGKFIPSNLLKMLFSIFRQHGVAGGYYMTFLLGSFMSAVSRLCRSNIRPLLLPAPGASPSILKHAYDVAGTVITVSAVNFICAPFMLLNVRDSLKAWRVLDWYGFWIIFGGLAFFYVGGTKLLKSFHPKQAETIRPKPTLKANIPGGGLTATPQDGLAPAIPT
jgi:lysophospholipid acyltransferase